MVDGDRSLWADFFEGLPLVLASALCFLSTSMMRLADSRSSHRGQRPVLLLYLLHEDRLTVLEVQSRISDFFSRFSVRCLIVVTRKASETSGKVCSNSSPYVFNKNASI